MAGLTTEAAKSPMDHLLYRAWATDELLYIGLTTKRNIKNRFDLHGRATRGWRWRTRVTINQLGLVDRTTAQLAESQAIGDERPLLNTMGNACILPNCGGPARADLMCVDHYANNLIPTWSLSVLLDLRSGTLAPNVREIPRPHLVARHHGRPALNAS